MSRVAIFFAEGYEEIEALTVVDILRRADIEITMVSVTGEMQVKGSHGIAVTMDKLLEDVDFEKLDMLVLPGGGRGTKGLEACEPLMRQVDAFISAGKDVAAICAAPSILGHRGHLKGRKACSYPSFESHLEGAQVVTDGHAVTDSNIVTGRGMGCSIPFALQILSKLRSEEEAEQIAAKIVFQEEWKK